MSFLKNLSIGRVRRLIVILPVLVRLSWRLARDGRVPKKHKAVLLAALGYVAMPIDVAPDVIPVIGRLDDLLIAAAGLAWAMRFAPDEVVDEHLADLGMTREKLYETLSALLPIPVEMAWRQRHRLTGDRPSDDGG